ncbi:MAG: GNAT family N-acetyltransferase [Pseudomonadota bacterium]
MNSVIRLARPDEIEALVAVEESADRAFAAIPELAWIANGGGPDIEPSLAPPYAALIQLGSVWVATENDILIGFVATQAVGRDLHVWELAVAADHQQKGVGRRLMETAEQWARARTLDSLTLTTFRSVPWNAPFYSRLGFEAVENGAPAAHLDRVLADEARRGLPDRCAMRLTLR